jgi:hypothetical protein
MKRITAFLILATLVGCTEYSELNKVVQNSSKVQISIFKLMNDGTLKDTVVFESTQADTIRKIGSFVSDKKTGSFTCGFAGKITFVNPMGMQEVDFNLSDNCRHFNYMINTHIYYQEITPEGYAYLDALRKQNSR